MKKKVIFALVFSAIGIATIAFLLTLGNSASAPMPTTPGAPPSTPEVVYPLGAADPDYTILCVKKGDGKIKFTKTGPYVTCPPDYLRVPVKLDPKLLKK
jgi:hypothetical protein